MRVCTCVHVYVRDCLLYRDGNWHSPIRPWRVKNGLSELEVYVQLTLVAPGICIPSLVKLGAIDAGSTAGTSIIPVYGKMKMV